MAGTTSATWEELARGYRQYRELPVWSVASVPNNRGLLSREDLRRMRDEGRRAADRVDQALDRLRRDPAFPASPGEVQQAQVDRIARERLLPRAALECLWEALIFDRDGYACRFCGREAWAVWQAEGRRRALRLVVEHLRPRTKLGGRNELAESVTACGSCHAIKAGLPADPFRDEFRSLAVSLAGRCLAERAPRETGER